MASFTAFTSKSYSKYLLNLLVNHLLSLLNVNTSMFYFFYLVTISLVKVLLLLQVNNILE
jgi:hypothetical protein